MEGVGEVGGGGRWGEGEVGSVGKVREGEMDDGWMRGGREGGIGREGKRGREREGGELTGVFP